MLFCEVNKRSITLIELLIVIVVLGVLISFAMPAFRGMQLRVIDSEAKTNLKILQTAVNSFRIDTGSYGPGGQFCTSVDGSCNARLGTDIPNGHWDYEVQIHGSLNPFGRVSINAEKINANECWHIWERNETAQDCCSGAGRCTDR